ncbi:hypothetical protein ACQJBY_043407 [Aegilops geniculata]
MILWDGDTSVLHWTPPDCWQTKALRVASECGRPRQRPWAALLVSKREQPRTSAGDSKRGVRHGRTPLVNATEMRTRRQARITEKSMAGAGLILRLRADRPKNRPARRRLAVAFAKSQIYMKRDNASSWNSGPERSKSEIPILHNSKRLETSRRIVLEYIKNIGRRNNRR